MPRKKNSDDDVFNDPLFVQPAERKEVTPTIEVDGQYVERKTIRRDPLQIKARLYTQIGELLHQLEGATDEPITVRERIAALVAIGRLQDLLIEKGKDEDENAGSAVRKYQNAFTKNGSRGRKKAARSAGDKLLLESDSEWGNGIDGDNPDAEADSDTAS